MHLFPKPTLLRYLPLTLAALALSHPAYADTDLFTISIPAGDGQFSTATFTLSSSPTPSSYTDIASFFTAVPVTVDGTTYMDEVGFSSEMSGLSGDFGFAESVSIVPGEISVQPVGDNFFIGVPGAALFTGSTAAPTFTTGSFTLQEGATLTITDVGGSTAVTPEPSSFVLFGTGLLGVAGAMRRRLVRGSRL